MSLAFFSGGSNSYCFLCATASINLIWPFCSGERDSRCFFFQQHLSLILELSDQERVTCNVCVVQQYYSSLMDIFLQKKATLVSIYVHQYWFLKSLPFSQEEGTCVNFCVQQYWSLKFWPFLRRKGLVLFLVCISIVDQNLCFLTGRERLLISFHCCRICFQIMFEKTFSMFFNLSWCSSAENSCNMHAIIAILVIFFHKHLVFLLHPSSFIYGPKGR